MNNWQKKSLLLQEQLKLSLTLPETEDTLQIFLPVQLCGKIHPPHFTSKYNLRESLHCQHQDIFEIWLALSQLQVAHLDVPSLKVVKLTWKLVLTLASVTSEWAVRCVCGGGGSWSPPIYLGTRAKFSQKIMFHWKVGSIPTHLVSFWKFFSKVTKKWAKIENPSKNG